MHKTRRIALGKVLNNYAEDNGTHVGAYCFLQEKYGIHVPRKENTLTEIEIVILGVSMPIRVAIVDEKKFLLYLLEYGE
jgi:hypothetical protein